MTVQTIKNAIKAVLQNPQLNKVTNWLNAEPHPLAYPSLCFGWLEWAGGPIEANSDEQKTVIDNFYIVILTKNANSEQGENNAIDLAEKTMELLVTDQTLSHNVTASQIINREKQKIFEGKFSINAVRLTLQTKRWS